MAAASMGGMYTRIKLLPLLGLVACGAELGTPTAETANESLVSAGVVTEDAPGVVTMNEAVVSTTPGYEKYVWTTPTPVANTSLVGIAGSASITNVENNFGEMLLTVFSYAGDAGVCPAQPKHFATYPQVNVAYPNMSILTQYIVKKPAKGLSSVPINFQLPGGAGAAGMPVGACMGDMLAGGGGNHTIKMQSELTLTFSLAKDGSGESRPGSLLSMGGEFCFGQTWGCQRATTDMSQTFAMASQVSGDSTLVALIGDVADSSVGAAQAKADAAWNSQNDFYLLRNGCGPFTPGALNGPAQFDAEMPSDAIHLLSVPLSGVGKSTLQQSIYTTFDNLAVHAGDCLVTVWGRGGVGSTDDETQVHALLRPGLPAVHLGLAPAACQAAGDCNDDGTIDQADYAILDANVGTQVTGGPAQGDLNSDGIVDGSDYTIIDNSYNTGSLANGGAGLAVMCQ